MLIYRFIKDNGEVRHVLIKLLSNVFVESWKEYLINLSKNTQGKLLWNFTLGKSPVSISANDDNQKFIKLKIKNFIDTFTWFNNVIGLDYSSELQTLNHILEFPLELRQSHLNHFHRIFTTLTRDYLEYGNTIPDNIDRLEFLKNVDSLNQNSHDLEPMSYLHLKNVNFIRTKITHNIRCVDAYSTINDRNAVWDNQVNINTPFDPLVDDYYHTVWLEEDIRGKDMIKAWVQEDDLTAEDCTGNLFLTPNILLDPYYTIPSIINHPDWRDQYIKSGKTLNRFPVGDIMDLDKVHWGELSEFKLEQIQLDNTILWRNISK